MRKKLIVKKKLIYAYKVITTSKDDDGTITSFLGLLFFFTVLETLSSGLSVLLWNHKKQLEEKKL